MTSLSTGRVMAIKGRSLSAEWRQVPAADFTLSLPKQSLSFPLPLFNSPRIYGQHGSIATARYHLKTSVIYLGLYRFLHPKGATNRPTAPKATLHMDDIPAFDVPEERRRAQDLE